MSKQCRVLLVARIDDLRLGPTLPRLETGKLAPIACGSPRDEMRCEEYSPSRRRRAPTSPRSVQASTSCKIFMLYAAVKWRLAAFVGTSVMAMEDKWDDGFTQSSSLALLHKATRGRWSE